MFARPRNQLQDDARSQRVTGRRNYDGLLSTTRLCRVAGDARYQEIPTATQNTIHDIHGIHKKYPFVNFVDISAMREIFA